ADRPDLADVLGGQRDLGVCSLAVCLEDALLPENRKTAAKELCRILEVLTFVPRSIFIRPADVETLEWLIEHLPLEHISGFILPKATVAKIHLWVERSAGLHPLLPILESREALDPMGRRELAQACAAHPSLIRGARIGANDLLSLLGGLRRPPGRTIYETPVGRVIDELLEASGNTHTGSTRRHGPRTSSQNCYYTSASPGDLGWLPPRCARIGGSSPHPRPGSPCGSRIEWRHVGTCLPWCMGISFGHP
ncbi:MAG: hypothetical protein B7X02_03140, partial [Rhodospirillales bacterium 12-54-5]